MLVAVWQVLRTSAYTVSRVGADGGVVGYFLVGLRKIQVRCNN